MIPTAGEVVAFFLDSPIELSRTVLDIAAVQLRKRTDARDARILNLPTNANETMGRKKRGRKSKAEKAYESGQVTGTVLQPGTIRP